MNEDSFFRDVLDNLHDGVYFIDCQRRITYWSKGAERIAGYGSTDVIGRKCADNLLCHINGEGKSICESLCPLAKSIEDGQTREAEIYLRHANGHRVPVLVRAAPLRDDSGQIVGAVETFSDNSARLAARRHVDQLRQEAESDALTGVGNRRHVERKLQLCLTGIQPTGPSFGLLFVDIDHFKTVNDIYGHDVGDRVLKMVAETMHHSLRASDCLARWGGEEFVVVIQEIDREQLLAIANKLRALVANSFFSVGPDKVQVTISIGATFGQVGDTIETIVQRADQLLYQSKLSGRNQVSFLES